MVATTVELIPRNVLRTEILKELARRKFFYFCHLTAPDFYKEERDYLVELCDEMQDFYESNDDVLIVNMPPRHGKSRTASEFSKWIFGKNPNEKIMTGSYNERLSTNFSKSVRNGILEQKADPDKIVYNDIFPKTRIKKGDGAMNLWALEGSYANYLATSPTGTATGFGATCFPAGTLIATPAGDLPIEKIASRCISHVFAYSHDSNERTIRKVEAIRKKSTSNFVHVHIANGVRIVSTHDHRFYTADNGYIRADVLRSGDKLLTHELEWVNVERVDVLYNEQTVDVYDLQVAHDHNFFANGVLVHNCLIIDDLIKNSMEAHNENVLDKHFEWFTNTMLSRLEEGGKIIIIMTRWANGDLAGRALKLFTEEGKRLRHINMKALKDDGTMLCEDVLSRRSFESKKRAMGEDIAMANYQQEPLDLKGVLYTRFRTYEKLPPRERIETIMCYVDTADTGADYLVSIVGVIANGRIYVTDVICTQDAMENTEPRVAKQVTKQQVEIAYIESNSGGRSFSRNVERIAREEGQGKLNNDFTSFSAFHQGANKIARILSNSTTVMRFVLYPEDWQERWPEYYEQISKYQRTGKNAHDDAADAITGLVEKASPYLLVEDDENVVEETTRKVNAKESEVSDDNDDYYDPYDDDDDYDD